MSFRRAAYRTFKRFFWSWYYKRLTKGNTEACNFIKKETLVQMFSYEFYEISKNTFSYRTSPVTAMSFKRRLYHYNYIEIGRLIFASDKLHVFFYNQRVYKQPVLASKNHKQLSISNYFIHSILMLWILFAKMWKFFVFVFFLSLPSVFPAHPTLK